jgi:hypothetical protein
MRRVLTISTGAVMRVLSMPATVLELYKVDNTISQVTSDNGKLFLFQNNDKIQMNSDLSSD